MNATAVRAFFHAAYELRNAAVHRGERAESVPTGGDRSLAFVDFVDAYASLVRAALRKHLLAHDAPVAPTWSDAAEATIALT